MSGPSRNAELRRKRLGYLRLYMEKRQQRHRSVHTRERVEPRCYRGEMPIGLRLTLALPQGHENSPATRRKFPGLRRAPHTHFRGSEFCAADEFSPIQVSTGIGSAWPKLILRLACCSASMGQHSLNSQALPPTRRRSRQSSQARPSRVGGRRFPGRGVCNHPLPRRPLGARMAAEKGVWAATCKRYTGF